MTCRLLRRPLIFCAGLCMAGWLQAATSEPIMIEADQLDLDPLAGTAVYTGNVTIRQAEMGLNADRVEIQRNDEGQVSQAIATGNPGRFRHRPEGSDTAIEGQAQQVIYHVVQRRVELIGQARLRQNGDRFSSARINYLVDQGTLEARSKDPNADDERVRMILEPES